MKLPENVPFVILDRNFYGDGLTVKMTEEFVDWIVRDCAKVCQTEGIGAKYQGDVYAAAILARYGLEPK